MPRFEFTFYGGAREFARYHGPEALVHGPSETGKTLSALYKLHLCANKYEDASLVILRRTQASAYSTVLRTYMNKVLMGEDNMKAANITAYGGEKPEWFDYPNGARIWVAGLDKAQKVLSAEHDIIYANQAEELTRGDWQYLTTRTTGRAGHMPYSQTIGDCNPSYPTHWMYHRDGLRMFHSKHEENPALYDPATGEITEQGKRTMLTLDNLTGIRKERLRYGRPAQAEGAIYDEWDIARHLLDRQDAPDTYHRWVAGQDWGYTNAGTFGAWGVDGDGRMYLEHQIYRTGKRIDWWVEQAAEMNERYGPFELVACDPSEPAYIDAYRRAGLNAKAADNSVVPGINEVKQRLANDRLFVLRDSLRKEDRELADRRLPTRVEDEFPMYVWADKKGKEVPVKENDHGMDMVRYSVMEADSGIRGIPQPESRESRWDPFAELGTSRWEV